MNYIVFDLESTCWGIDNGREHEIIEIGAVKVKDDKITDDEFQIFIKPTINPVLSEFCTKLTTIAQPDVENALTFFHALPLFFKWITDNGKEPYWLCSWGFYDRKMLKLECERLGKATRWLKPHISIKHQYGKIQRVNNCGMITALEQLGLEQEGILHRGIDDSRNIAKIFLRVFEKLEFE